MLISILLDEPQKTQKYKYVHIFKEFLVQNWLMPLKMPAVITDGI